jgi:hypothetical protein
LKGHEYDLVFTRDYDRKQNLFYGPDKVESDTIPRKDLRFPENVSFYFNHLDKLGLAGIYQEGNQEPLYFDSERREQCGVRIRSKYKLSDFGKEFVRACMPAVS